ncbi:MAG: hypothetical protein HY347_00425 [candidate division NC10 bacterium]|nr:hypothetical protein [candidate division NC10 bacterium]
MAGKEVIRRCERCGRSIRPKETYTQQGYPDFSRISMLCRSCYIEMSREIRRKVAEERKESA